MQRLILVILLISLLVLLFRWLRTFLSGLDTEELTGVPEEKEKYYASILELQGAITPDKVRRQYRELIAKYHPDKVQHLGAEFREMAERKTKELNRAYEFFSQRFE